MKEILLTETIWNILIECSVSHETAYRQIFYYCSVLLSSCEQRYCRTHAKRKLLPPHMALPLTIEYPHLGRRASPTCSTGVQQPSCRSVVVISTLHMGPGQPDSRPYPNLNLNPNPNPNPLGGLRSTGIVTLLRIMFWWRVSKNTPAAERSAWTNNTNDREECFCTPVLRLGRVLREAFDEEGERRALDGASGGGGVMR